MELTVTLQNEEWYRQLIEECHAIVVETEFSARWALVEGYHELGKRILEDNNNFEKSGYGKKIVQCIGESLGKSENTIYYAIQFARKFPELADVPGGKDTSWYRICNELLPGKKDGKTKVRADRTKKYPIISLSINDLETLDYDTSEVTDEIMLDLITKIQIKSDFTSVWEQLPKVAKKLKIPKNVKPTPKPV